MSSHSETTTDHDAIRQWVESRQGRPTRVKGTGDEHGEGILRIDFAEPDEKLEEISWDEFFETFDDRNLAFLHQDKTADGKTSRFFKFVRREDDGGSGRKGGSGAGRHGASHRSHEGDSHAGSKGGSHPAGKGPEHRAAAHHASSGTDHKGSHKTSDGDHQGASHKADSGKDHKGGPRQAASHKDERDAHPSRRGG
jgi:hypothetical protein